MVTKVCNYCPPGIIPLSYDESLSYYEVLCKLREKVNELIGYFNGMDTYATESYVRQTVADAYTMIQEQLLDLDRYINAELEKKLDKTEFTTFVTEVSLSINSMSDQIRELRIDTNANTEAIIYNFNWLKNYIDNQLIDLEVVNPFTGITQPIQDVLNYMSNIMRDNALTASEYDGYELTATAYDALDLTAYQFDNDGKDYIS